MKPHITQITTLLAFYAPLSAAGKAQKFLSKHKNIKLLREGADEFATFARVP